MVEVRVIHHALSGSALSHALDATLNSQEACIEYNNPFEHKLVLPKTHVAFFQALIHPIMLEYRSVWWISHLLNVDISHADWTHYGGVFIYRVSDYLKPHVDAGKHPKS